MMRSEEEKDGGDKERPEKSISMGEKGGTVDKPVCELCGQYHRPVYLLDDGVDLKVVEEELEQLAKECSQKISKPALLTMFNLVDKVAQKDKCCTEAAEHAARFMLTQGAKWVHIDQNQRAKWDDTTLSSNTQSTSSSSSKVVERKKEITEMPASTIAQIKNTPAHQLTSESLMEKFRKMLLNPKMERWAALRALAAVSAENLKELRTAAGKENWDSEVKALFDLLAGFPLSLTHYADKCRGYLPEEKKPAPKKPSKELEEPLLPKGALSLYSRIFLDSNAPELGIVGYPKGNTPSMAFKNVGHVDYVFMAIEPRQSKQISRPRKVGSRFGNFCHLIDFEQLPFFSILTLGDLDTCNAKIGVNRLTNGSDSKTADELGFNALNVKKLIGSCESIKTNQSGIQASQKIFVRKFATRSEQIFIRDDIKEALALKVLIDCQRYGFLDSGSGLTKKKPTAADYNCLINGLFVPQIMVPRAFCTKQAYMFDGSQ